MMAPDGLIHMDFQVYYVERERELREGRWVSSFDSTKADKARVAFHNFEIFSKFFDCGVIKSEEELLQSMQSLKESGLPQ